MAEVVKGLGIGGQTLAQKELGWNRRTIRKGMQELESGVPIMDGYHRSGRKRVEVRLPNLLRNIQSIVDPQSQTDPSFKSTRLHTRITASQVNRQLTEQFGYCAEELPSNETIRRRLNELGYTLKRILKTKPIKKIAQTLVINQDNGQENNSRRTQFMKRIVDFSTSSQLNLQLAYYPPYHSKYNPIERCFGWLEQHWNGSLLETVETVLKFAQNLSFKGKNPVVRLIKKVYSKGVKLTRRAMAEIESCISRFPNLKKWFVEIFPQSS
jgi:transposase